MLIGGVIAVLAALIVAVVLAARGGGGDDAITAATAAGSTAVPAAPTLGTESEEVTAPKTSPDQVPVPPTAELTVPTFPDFSFPSPPTFPDLSLPDTPETLAPPGSIPPATQTPEGLGDDSELDALARACYDGDMDACDQLYGQSDEGSDYETYGDTCAGRQDRGTGQYCRESFPS